ncbi:MAG: V-type ATP synthase subunit I [Tissierellia bacterium]|nr:V-type ATP synthase subunit I [Tissierellia bacterium]
MSKFSLFAFDSERENLLHELQKFGYVHFDSLDDKEDLLDEGLETVTIPESIGEVDEEISKVKYAIDLLSKYDERETGIKAMIKGKESLSFEELEGRAAKIDYLPVYNELRQLASELDRINVKIKDLESQINEYYHWKGLNYPINDLNSLRQVKVFMGIIPKKMKENFNKDSLDLNYTYIEAISEDKDNVYLFAMSLEDEAEAFNEILRNNSFSSIKLEGEKTPREEINTINNEISSLSVKSGEITAKIKELSKNLPDFEIMYEYLMNKKLRLMASENFLRTDKVNVISGYIPTDMEEEFENAVKKSLKDAYYLEIKEAEKDDPNVPVLLKNSKFTETFESLTSMYALPLYNEIDPTPLLAPFYLAFFGMMVGDAGYGIIMLIGTLIALRVANLSESQEKFIRFFHYLSYSTIAWGVIYGSYFGGIIPIKGLVDPANQYQELLVGSMVFGLIHLFFGLGIKGYMYIREKKYFDALCDVGFWYMAVAGGIVFLLTIVTPMAAIVKTISLAVMVIGMVGIVLTAGRSAASVGGKLAGGLYELYGISGYVGDIVSYSRLMALGLSGGFIASSINMMIDMLFSKGILGIIIGIVVFLVGQLFNIFLSLLGAYVHTLRLTYVEFFGKFYEGGGRNFKLFRNKTKYINLK